MESRFPNNKSGRYKSWNHGGGGSRVSRNLQSGPIWHPNWSDMASKLVRYVSRPYRTSFEAISDQFGSHIGPLWNFRETRLLIPWFITTTFVTRKLAFHLIKALSPQSEEEEEVVGHFRSYRNESVEVSRRHFVADNFCYINKWSFLNSNLKSIWPPSHLEAVAAIFKRCLFGSVLLLVTKSFFD